MGYTKRYVVGWIERGRIDRYVNRGLGDDILP